MGLLLRVERWGCLAELDDQSLQAALLRQRPEVVLAKADEGLEPLVYPGRELLQTRHAADLEERCYLEWWAQGHIGLDAPPVVTALGPSYGDYTRKLAADLARTCFAGAELSRDWMKIATAAGDGVEAETRPTEKQGDEGAPEVDTGDAETTSKTQVDAANSHCPDGLEPVGNYSSARGATLVLVDASDWGCYSGASNWS